MDKQTGCADRSKRQRECLGGRGAERRTDWRRWTVRHRGLEHVDAGDHVPVRPHKDKLGCDHRAAEAVMSPGHVAQLKGIGGMVIGVLERDTGVLYCVFRGMAMDDRPFRRRAVQVLSGEYGQHRHGRYREERRTDTERSRVQQQLSITAIGFFSSGGRMPPVFRR